jgi:hypothetical protein
MLNENMTHVLQIILWSLIDRVQSPSSSCGHHYILTASTAVSLRVIAVIRKKAR